MESCGGLAIRPAGRTKLRRPIQNRPHIAIGRPRVAFQRILERDAGYISDPVRTVFSVLVGGRGVAGVSCSCSRAPQRASSKRLRTPSL